MSKLMRECSLEAIAASLGAKTHDWYGRQNHRIPMEDAAMALCGADSLAAAFWRVSMGHDAPEDLDACTAYLMGCAAWEAESDRWKAGRLERMVKLCLEELAKGYAAKEGERAKTMKMSARNWRDKGTRWQARYARMMRDAMQQVNAAQVAIGRRVAG